MSLRLGVSTSALISTNNIYTLVKQLHVVERDLNPFKEKTRALEPMSLASEDERRILMTSPSNSFENNSRLKCN